MVEAASSKNPPVGLVVVDCPACNVQIQISAAAKFCYECGGKLNNDGPTSQKPQTNNDESKTFTNDSTNVSTSAQTKLQQQ